MGEDIAKQHEITDSMQPDDPQVNSASGVNVQPLAIKYGITTVKTIFIKRTFSILSMEAIK